MARGRPSKYKPKYCALLVDMMKQGKSYQQVAAEIGVSKVTMWRWRDKHPDFDEACQLGSVQSCAWWENEAMSGLHDKDKPKHWATMMMYTMKCRFKDFGYHDKTEQTIEVTNKVEEMSNSDLDKALEALTREESKTPKPTPLIKTSKTAPPTAETTKTTSEDSNKDLH